MLGCPKRQRFHGEISDWILNLFTHTWKEDNAQREMRCVPSVSYQSTRVEITSTPSYLMVMPTLLDQVLEIQGFAARPWWCEHPQKPDLPLVPNQILPPSTYVRRGTKIPTTRNIAKRTNIPLITPFIAASPDQSIVPSLYVTDRSIAPHPCTSPIDRSRHPVPHQSIDPRSRSRAPAVPRSPMTCAPAAVAASHLLHVASSRRRYPDPRPAEPPRS
jgi:hypothetical protein